MAGTCASIEPPHNQTETQASASYRPTGTPLLPTTSKNVIDTVDSNYTCEINIGPKSWQASLTCTDFKISILFSLVVVNYIKLLQMFGACDFI